MAKSNTITAYEYCKLYRGGNLQSHEEVSLPEKTFDMLCQYVEQNETVDDVDQIMTINHKGRRFIRLSKYVGTIQTADGITIEVLPKIYRATEGSIIDAQSCRKVFLEMLKHFQGTKAKFFQTASISSTQDFPLLEVYISNYLDSLEELLTMGLRKGYTQVEENSDYLKGKLLVSQNIRFNAVDQSKFYIRHSSYLEDIPQNRILMSTLDRLMELTSSPANESRIYALQGRMGDIPVSSNIEVDLKACNAGNRLFSAYDQLLDWSDHILHGEGFTSFAGSTVNLALFFSAESLFESYVAYLFKEYAQKKGGWNIYPQHQDYYLIDKHRGNGGIFKLRPDIVAISKTDSYDVRIFDTKWKIVNAKDMKGNYGISQSDMYQLYAYGQKYRIKNDYRNPSLMLVFPATNQFNKEQIIEEFIYDDIEEGLKIKAIPFDLSVGKDGCIEQVESILTNNDLNLQ